MRIIITADLHYDVIRSQAPTRAIAREICELGGDCLMIVGDSASADLAVLEEVFALFEPFGGVRLAVAGNHELWTAGRAAPGDRVVSPEDHGAMPDSLHRYENELRQVCSRCGVHYLDSEPCRLGDVALVGSVGWYDYSFRPARMKIPLRFYQHKMAPGAALYLGSHAELLTGDDIPPAAREVTSRWMDGERVRLPMGDREFTGILADKLRRHLGQVDACSERIIVGIHHLPFAELVPRSIIPNWEFANAFMGSELLGETLLEFPKISHVYCGHSHRPARCRKGWMECINVGCTYREKRYEVLEI